jgi:hypothetical protein
MLVPHKKKGETSAKLPNNDVASDVVASATLSLAPASASSKSIDTSHDASIPTPTHDTSLSFTTGSGMTHSAPIVDATHSKPSSAERASLSATAPTPPSTSRSARTRLFTRRDDGGDDKDDDARIIDTARRARASRIDTVVGVLKFADGVITRIVIRIVRSTLVVHPSREHPHERLVFEEETDDERRRGRPRPPVAHSRECDATHASSSRVRTNESYTYSNDPIQYETHAQYKAH